MVHLKYEDILNIIHGATLMGGGGGGSMSGGVNMLDGYAASHGGRDAIDVTMYTTDEMSDGTHSAVIAGMGAPTKIPADFSPWVKNAFDFYSYVQAFSSNKIAYTMAVELGGFNTFIPMLVSLENDIPFLDVDGSARAVPALTTLLFAVNGYDTLPIVLANYIEGTTDFAKVLLDFPNDAKNASLAEDAARDYLASEMDQIGGLCGWLTAKDEFDAKKLPLGSVTLAGQVGQILRNTPAEDVFSTLKGKGILDCKGISGYYVSDGETKSGDGFDYGYIVFANDEEKSYYRVDFQNENLVFSNGSNPDLLTPVMTAPDIICAFRTSDNTPLTNSDFFDADGKIITGVKVMLGMIKVSDVWWYSGYDAVNTIWKEYFAHVNYRGDIIQYK